MKILKKLLIAAAVLVFLAVATIAIAGFFLPPERSFVNEIDIDAPAERVWQVIADRQKYPEWQTQLGSVEVIDEQTWIEHPKDSPDALRFQVVRDDRPSSMEFSYAMGTAIRGGWKGEATPTANGVRLKTTDSYRTDHWMMKMLLGAFFDLDGFAKDWNTRLKQRVEALHGKT